MLHNENTGPLFAKVLRLKWLKIKETNLCDASDHTLYAMYKNGIVCSRLLTGDGVLGYIQCILTPGSYNGKITLKLFQTGS